jgi:hypothetical protein
MNPIDGLSPPVPAHGPRLSVAWAYDDDLEADTCPG